MARAYDTPRMVSLEIEVRLAPLPGARGERFTIAVYAFARSGQLIDKSVLQASGRTRLHLPDLRVMQEVLVMIGPDASAEHSTVVELSRRGAKEQFVRISAAQEPPLLQFDIEAALRSVWGRQCLVRGVLRRSEPNREARDSSPMREASVQIWEIEPVDLMIAKLPDAIVDDFRALLLEAAGLRECGAALVPVQRSSLRAARLHYAKPLVAAHMQQLRAAAHFDALARLAQESTIGLRDHLMRFSTEMRVLLCLLYPAWIRKHIIGTAATDAKGQFEALVFPSSHCGKLNLYFTASAMHLGLSIPVYDPRPVANFTYWGYQEGAEVALLADGVAAAKSESSPAADVRRAARRLLAAGNA